MAKHSKSEAELMQELIEVCGKTYDFCESISDMSVEVFVAIWCTVVDSYCAANGLNSTKMVMAMAEHVKYVNEEEGPMQKPKRFLF